MLFRSDFSMGIYTEKREQLIEKIKGLEKRIASDTAKKKTLKDELKEVSRLAMAEEYNASGLSDDELKLVEGGNAENEKSDTANLAADFGQQMSFTDKANPYED